jgi:hypothetical protein
MIWPLGIISRALTSSDDNEIKNCIQTLQRTHAGTGFMHESFKRITLKLYPEMVLHGQITIFGELHMETFISKPALLNQVEKTFIFRQSKTILSLFIPRLKVIILHIYKSKRLWEILK